MGDDDLFKSRNPQATLERIKELTTLVKEYCPKSFTVVSHLMKRMSRTEYSHATDVNKGIMKFCKEAKEAKKFVITRFKVMMENLVDQVTDEDKFDFLSKVLLELSELVFEGVAPQDLLKRLVSSKGTHLLGKLLVRSMKDIGTLQLHYKQLTTQFMDLTLIALMSLNHAMTQND